MLILLQHCSHARPPALALALAPVLAVAVALAPILTPEHNRHFGHFAGIIGTFLVEPTDCRDYTLTEGVGGTVVP